MDQPARFVEIVDYVLIFYNRALKSHWRSSCSSCGGTGHGRRRLRVSSPSHLSMEAGTQGSRNTEANAPLNWCIEGADAAREDLRAMGIDAFDLPSGWAARYPESHLTAAEAREQASCAEPPGSSRSVCGVELVGGEGGGARGGGAATTHESVASRQARSGGGLCQMAARERPLRAALGPVRGREAARRASRLAACCGRGGTGGTGGRRTFAALGAAAAPSHGGTRMDCRGARPEGSRA